MRYATTAFFTLGALVAGTAHAACDGSSDPCSIDLGTVIVSFEQGAAAYFADAQVTQGSDASVTAVPVFLPVTVTGGPGQAGFSFQPMLFAAVGGSGINGYHEVLANLSFTGVSFAAKPGYAIDGVMFTFEGTAAMVGDASIGVPGPLQLDGSFAGSFGVDPAHAEANVGFSIAAAYLAGDDGTAVSYGTANAAFTRVGFLATVSAVPEPSGVALVLAGLGLLALRCRAAPTRARLLR